VSTIAFTIGGIKSLSKMTTSTMRIMFSDEFIADYSWKGQKKKKSLEASPIHKVIISRQYSYQLFFIIYDFNIYKQVSHP